MLASSSMRPPPLREPNSSRTSTGKASEKKAENGLRRNSLFWARNWRQSRAGSDGRPSAGRSDMDRHLGAGQPEVDVLQGGPGHGQGLQLLAPGQGPGGEDVQGPGRLGGAQLDPVLVRARPAGQVGWQVGHGRARRQAEGDLRLALVAGAGGGGGAGGPPPARG